MQTLDQRIHILHRAEFSTNIFGTPNAIAHVVAQAVVAQGQPYEVDT